MTIAKQLYGIIKLNVVWQILRVRIMAITIFRILSSYPLGKLHCSKFSVKLC